MRIFLVILSIAAFPVFSISQTKRESHGRFKSKIKNSNVLIVPDQKPVIIERREEPVIVKREEHPVIYRKKLPPGQAKKLSGVKSAKAFTPAQRKKAVLGQTKEK